MPDPFDDELRVLITELVDAAPPAPSMPRPPETSASRSGGSSHRSPRAVLAFGVTVVLVIAAAVGYLVSRPDTGSHRVATEPTASPTPAGVGLTAAQLAGGTWSKLPAPPVPVGGDASVVWTGKELIVWGGSSGDQTATLYNSGAAYDPTTNRWRVLPKAPISARTGQATAWTGHEMIVWGGYDARGQTPHVTNDGAAYTPLTNSWHRLPAFAAHPRAGAQALWVGHVVVILGGSPAITTNSDRVVRQVVAYDPAENSWRTMDDLPSMSGHDLFAVQAVASGRQLVAFDQWAQTTDLGGGQSVGSAGSEIFRLDPSSGRWTAAPSSGSAPAVGVLDPVWSGVGILTIANAHAPGAAGPGPVFPARSLRFDPVSGRWAAMTPGPVDDEGAISVWTGASLIRLNPATTTSVGTPRSMTLAPGDLAAWDPANDTWTSLPRAPSGFTAGQLIWTGKQLVVWGARYEADATTPVIYRYDPPR